MNFLPRPAPSKREALLALCAAHVRREGECNALAVLAHAQTVEDIWQASKPEPEHEEPSEREVIP